jgi:DNA repair exonuclease SbcCD ATPase subunit
MNAIVGETNSGKSSISRALYWALYNKPTRVKDEFMMYGAKHCFVTVIFSDGTEITRGRNNDENYYILKQGEKATEFKGFGFEVPPEITEAHGMRLVDFDDSGQDTSLNVSMQLDPIFMFEDSATRRAKVIGKISGADRADGALGIAAGWLKDTRGKRADLVKHRNKLDEQISEYNFLEEMGELIEELSRLVDQEKITSALRDNIVAEVANYHVLMVEKAKVEVTIAMERQLIQYDEYLSAIDELFRTRSVLEATMVAYMSDMQSKEAALRIIRNSDKVIGLDTLLTTLTESIRMRDVLQESHDRYIQLRSELDDINHYVSLGGDLMAVETLLTQVDRDTARLNALRKCYADYIVLLGQHGDGAEALVGLSDKLIQKDRQLKEALSGFDVCPVCLSKIRVEDI